MNYVKEEMKLLNMEKVNLQEFDSSSPKVFAIEKELTLEQKIAFIDAQANGVASYLMELFSKWGLEKDTLPQDKYRPKTVSMRAWLRKNDPRGIINSEYSMGSYNLFGTGFGNHSLTLITPNERKLTYVGQHIAEQWFHDLLKQLYKAEQKHFVDNDPFEIKLKKARDFGDKYTVLFHNTEIHDIVWNRKEDVPESRLDMYIAAYEKLELAATQIETELNASLQNDVAE